jgi:type IV pilus modification protein PilV
MIMKKIFRRAVNKQGFTLIEVMISIVILMIGLLTVLALFAKGLSATQFAQQDMIAKQKAREQLEAIYAARNDGTVTWANIQNSPTGIYLTGFNQIYAMTNSSTDIMGTANHGAVNDFYVTRTGTGNFVKVPLNFPNWQRSVLIVNDPNNVNLRQITVTVRVTNGGLRARDYTVVGEISNAQ